MALQSLSGFDDESTQKNKGSEGASWKDAQYPSVESIIRIFEEQLKSEDHSLRLNFIRTLLSGKVTYAPMQIVEYALCRALFLSAYHADFQATQLLLEGGIDVNELDIEKGMTPLTLAMNYQNHDYISYLLQNGANLFALLGDKDTALEWIMQEVSEDTFKCILDNSPSICKDLIAKPNVFDSCIEDGKIANSVLLLNRFKEEGIIVNVSPSILEHIAYHADAEILRMLCALGFQIDIFDDLTVQAFNLAIMTGNSDMVTLLLEQGILTPSLARGEKALHIAIESEREDIIKALINANVDINGLTETGKHPLMLAAETDNPIIFGMMMDQNPDLTGQDLNELVDVMTMSMKIQYPEIMDKRDAMNPVFLNQKGIDFDSKYEDPSNLNFDTLDCIQLLKDLLQLEYVPEDCIYTIVSQRKVDINAKVDTHGTFLHFAAAKNLIYAMRVLLKLGANINAQNGEMSSTPLFTAIHKGNKEAAMLLIELGADCELTDEFENTPLMEAITSFDMEHRVVIELLRAGVYDHGLIFAADN
ncbi:MAG: ankyrin repeat domain-containing protein [Ignavibacteria bacterium]